MHLQTHLLASWAIGSGLTERRDRRLVAWAGVLPDLDALSLALGRNAYERWHHVLTHNLLSALVVSACAMLVARQKVATTMLALAAFHVHLLLDVAGSGPEWTIAYFYPFAPVELGVSWAWPLTS